MGGNTIGAMNPKPQPHDQEVPGYRISTSPGGRLETAAAIPDALAALATQLVGQLPKGSVEWQITDPAGTRHRGSNDLNGRLDLITPAIEELVDDLYAQLHRAADGGPRRARTVGGRGGPDHAGHVVDDKPQETQAPVITRLGLDPTSTLVLVHGTAQGSGLPG